MPLHPLYLLVSRTSAEPVHDTYYSRIFKIFFWKKGQLLTDRRFLLMGFCHGFLEDLRQFGVVVALPPRCTFRTLLFPHSRPEPTQCFLSFLYCFTS
jgi:hypothetical protein